MKPEMPELRDEVQQEYSQLSQTIKLPDESWQKYQETWNAYDVSVSPKEIFPALREMDVAFARSGSVPA